MKQNRNAFCGGAYSLILSAVVLTILIVVNILVNALPENLTKYDISAAKLYSITSNTKAVVNGLDEDVTIYWIVQADKEDAVIENLLNKYDSLSDHIQIVKKNPDVYPTFAEQYTDEEAANNSLVVECGERSRFIGYDDIYVQEADIYSYSYNTSFDGEGAITSAIDYVVNEGDGAFYGPKIDFHLTDSIGRTWQCGTIQLDMQLPQRFELEYTGADGEKHRPIMIHRVAFGSIERFIGILIEHFAGAFPTWLAPVQVKVLPISDKHLEYGQKVLETLNAAGIRAEIDTRAEKIGYKIREAQMQKIPYMLVVGAKEEEENLVSVRSRFAGDEGQKSLDAFVASVAEEIATRERREVVKEEN